MHRHAVLFAAALACACGAGAPRTVASAGPDDDRARDTPSAVDPSGGSRARRSIAISGGTLLAARDGRTVIAADPDRDRIWIVDLDTMIARAPIALRRGDEPGRLTEDGAGLVHVVLRRGGAVVTIDPSSGAILMRRPVCPAPRGIDYDELDDAIVVACTDGALVTFGALDPRARRTLRLGADLRDVVVTSAHTYVSRFRDAEVLEVGHGGDVHATLHAPRLDVDAIEEIDPVGRPRRVFTPRVAWRLAKDGRGDLWMIHQRAANFPVDMAITERAPVRSLPYGGLASPRLLHCPPGIVHSALTRFRRTRAGAASTILPSASLPVDVAVSPDGSRIAMAFAGESTRSVAVAFTSAVGLRCSEDHGRLSEPGALSAVLYSHPIAVAWIDAGHLAVQYQQPPAVVVFSTPLLATAREARLGDALPRDPGHGIFHRSAPAGMACASCHPEGDDDGHVWQLGAHGGVRRTQTLGGGVLGGPLHWSGDLASLDVLMDEVFVERMGGVRPLPGDLASLGAFLDALPPPPGGAVHDAGAVQRGRALFAARGCGECHAGARFSDERTHDVGTGEPLRTPTLLGLAARAPYFHDGRVPTLRARFDEGGHTPGHGDLTGLDARAIDDLTAYLASL